jgi:acetyl esterase/lipase
MASPDYLEGHFNKPKMIRFLIKLSAFTVPGPHRFTIMLTLILSVFAGSLRAQLDSLVLPLWKNGAPGFENRKNEPEEARDYWVKNIHNPGITVYFPRADIANGTAVVICPGGGHRLLVFKSEGIDPARYLNKLGIVAIILKYRLAREPNSPYSLDKQPQEDAYRAMRLVRSHCKEWKIDSSRVGMLGFSAGGEVVDVIAFAAGNGNATASDPVDRLNGKPDFIIQIYPGPLNIPDSVPHNAPPAFLLAANDDTCCSVTVIRLLEKYRQAKGTVEAHILEHGDHGFNMGYRSSLQSVKTWPLLMTNWLLDNKLIKQSSDR